MLTLRAFGPLDVLDADGQSLVGLLSQSKRAALLSYLALSHPDQLVRRDHLLGLFWPELDQQHGRNALSQSLSFLRRELGDGVLVTRGVEEVGVDDGGITSDVVAFEAAVAAEDWAAALETYRGDLLEGLHVAGAAPFVDWVDRERQRLREAAAEAAWRLAHERIGEGELTEAERVAQRALLLVPTDESPVRGFIEALAGAGDRAAALRFYERFREVLAQELEVEPAPETVAVMEAVRARSEAVSVVGNGGIHARSPAETVAERPTPPTRPAPRRARWVPIAGLSVLALLVGGYALHARSVRTGGPGTLIGQGVTARYDGVVVADLSSPFDPGLGTIASELLRAGLDQSDIVRPVAGTAIGAALGRMERDPSLPFDAVAAREVATRDGYPLVVVGEIEDVGRTYLLTVRLESPNGEVLGRFHGSATEADLIRTIDRIGGEIRARIGDSRRAIRRSPPLEQVTTASLDALRLYSQAVRVRDLEGRDRDAIPLMERAIEIDTAFASAYRKLVVTLADLEVEPSRRAALIEHAYAHRARLTEIERLRVEDSHFFYEPELRGANECQMFEPVVRRYETYVRLHPEDPRPLHQYGYYLARVGRRDDAIEAWRRAIALGEDPVITYHGLFVAQLKIGHRAAAIETLRQWRRRLGDSPALLWATSQVAYVAGDYDAADSVYRTGLRQSGSDAELYLAQLDVLRGRAHGLDALRGRVRGATANTRGARPLLRRQGPTEEDVDVVVWLSLARLTAPGDTAAAVGDAAAVLESMVGQELDPFVLMRVGLLYALAAEPQRAREVLDGLSARGVGNWAIVATLLRAPIELANGDPEAALATLDEADIRCETSRTDLRLLPLMRARAEEMAGRLDSAIAGYEAYLAGYPRVDWDAVFLFDTLERLGGLYEDRGDSAKAAATYARAADQWKDADPELQPRVRGLQQRANQLRRRSQGAP